MIFGTKSVASVIGAFTKVLEDLKEVASNSENIATAANSNSDKVREKANQQIMELAQTAKSALEEKNRANAIILKLEELLK